MCMFYQYCFPFIINRFAVKPLSIYHILHALGVLNVVLFFYMSINEVVKHDFFLLYDLCYC